MSFDLAVWPQGAVKSKDEALKLYEQLCGDPARVYESLPTAEGIDAFYQELTARHPEIDDVPEEEIDNTDLCPWSVAFDRSDKHILLCAVWSRAEYVEQLVRTLAEKHGLALYNPQTGSLHLPGGSARQSPARPWWKLW